MNFSLQTHAATTLHRLRGHQFLSLHKPKGLCVRAQRGFLWLTVDGDPTDIELAPGEWRVFDGSANVVVGTLGGDAVLSTTTPAASPWVARLRDWLQHRLQHRLKAGLHLRATHRAQTAR